MHFTLSALSRGAGVPEAARNAIQAVRAVLISAQRDGRDLHFEEQRIGLEGEVRLCIRFPDRKTAEDFVPRIRRLIEGVELVHFVEERCPNPGPRG